MSPFVYRLQKVHQLRENRKKEQERRVQKARERVKQIESAIVAKKSEIRQVRENMLSTSHMLLQSHDMYLDKLNDELDQLHQDLELAKNQLAFEMQLLIKAQADLEALNKHKERTYEEYLEEEKQKDLRIMDEIAGQRYFRSELEKRQTEQAEIEAAQELDNLKDPLTNTTVQNHTESP